MFWYKAWLETRSRFLVSVFGVTVLCSWTVFHWDKNGLSYAKPSYYYSGLHVGHSLLATMWVLAVTLLMMGGPLREKAVGAAPFTLALPVTRARLMEVRIGMGLLQAAALIVIPWCAMFLINAAWEDTYSIAQAWFHVGLLAGGGLLFFAIALLVSSIVEGEYTAPIVSYVIVIAIAAAFSDQSLTAYSPWAFMMGSGYFDRDTSLLVGPFPWCAFAVYISMAVLFMLFSILIIKKREF